MLRNGKKNRKRPNRTTEMVTACDAPTDASDSARVLAMELLQFIERFLQAGGLSRSIKTIRLIFFGENKGHSGQKNWKIFPR